MLGATLAAPAAHAQAVDGTALRATTADGSAASCVARSAPDALYRVVVHLEPDVDDSADRAILPVADLLAELVRERVHRTLGANPGVLPAGDSLVDWRGLAGRFSVIVHGDGRFDWRTPSDSVVEGLAASELLPEERSRGATALLAGALASLRDDGERVFWPEGLAGDSAEFELHFHHASVQPDGTAEPLRIRRALPLFSLPVPWMTEVAVVEPPEIAYPPHSQRGGAVGTVILNFVVGVDGRADSATVHDVWPADRPRLTGAVGRFYDEFRAAAERGVRGARFKPGTIAGCAVPRLVQQAFDYNFRR